MYNLLCERTQEVAYLYIMNIFIFFKQSLLSKYSETLNGVSRTPRGSLPALKSRQNQPTNVRNDAKIL